MGGIEQKWNENKNVRGSQNGSGARGAGHIFYLFSTNIADSDMGFLIRIEEKNTQRLRFSDF